MEDIIERVARAIVDENHRVNPTVALWVDQPEMGRSAARATARAAIEAISRTSDEEVERAARAMIDEYHQINPAADAWCYLDKFSRYNARVCARATLAAFLDPASGTPA